jgi:molybdopterin/thiamine biosynthesis adenylyltransferase
MTIAPQIFLYQEQVDELWHEFARSRNGQQRQALGMELDDGDVYHVYTAPPRTHFAGVPCLGVVVMRDVPPEAELDLTTKHPAKVVIYLSPGNGGSRTRGFAYREERWVEGDVKVVPLRAEIHSRSAGLLETDALERKAVAVVGLGSGGSAIAVALAQAGVGRMKLVDRDRLEIGNVSRHACGVGDLGRKKTRAVRDLLVGKNPAIEVYMHDLDLVEQSFELNKALDGVDLVVGATDGDLSRFVLNQAALDLGIVTVFGRVLSRAAGGEVLRVRPHSGPCLACVYTERFLAQRPREYSRLSEVREDAASYVSEADLESQIQVGLTSDIAPVANLMTKIALVELSRDTNGGLEALDADLLADFYVWANRREGVYASWSPMRFSFTQPSILRWYGANVSRRSDCGACGVRTSATSGFFGN